MKIKEFLEGRNVSYAAVQQYIKRNPEKFKGHIGKDRAIDLDDVAIGILDEKYPVPSPVEIMDNPELLKQLDELKEDNRKLLIRITQLQEENIEKTEKIAELQQQVLLQEPKKSRWKFWR